MTTQPHVSHTRRHRRGSNVPFKPFPQVGRRGFLHRAPWPVVAVLAVATILVAAAALAGHTPGPAPAPSSPMALTEAEEREGMAPRPAYERAPAVAATFLRDGYRPGQVASLVLWRPERHFTVQFFRASQMHTPKWRNITMQGIPVTPIRRIKGLPAHTPLRFRIGNWRSGVYFARLRARRLTGFAPFVVRPKQLGEHGVLVVEPTFTWQAYNFRDDNHDGIGDTWYADHNQTSINLVRPFLSRGMPPHFPIYDLPFLNWLEKTGKRVDFMSDSQFAALRSARALPHAYRLIIFPGHHEYVTKREYDLTVGYRNFGGHLMFLSADNFYWKVVRHGDRLVRTAAWRAVGRPEAALIGVAFIRNDGGRHQGRWTVRNTRRYPWLFGDTRLRVGSRFGHGGIEIDHTNSASPPGTTVIADMRNLMGPGVTAQMSYYQTPRGAEVFAAGAFTLGGARNPVSCHIIQHVWDHLTRPKGLVALQRGRGLASLQRAARVRPTYGYPVKPFRRRHPVRGVFGDPRIDLASTGVKRQFHFGLDVWAPNGTPVYPTISGTIALHPLHNDVVLVDAQTGSSSATGTSSRRSRAESMQPPTGR